MVAGESGLQFGGDEQRAQVRALQLWVQAYLQQSGVEIDIAESWQPLGGDAGFRQYFRFTLAENTGAALFDNKNGCSLLAVWAPPETEKNHEFVTIARFLKSQGVHTPEVYAFDPACGFLLVEDLGASMLFDHVVGENVEQLYAPAFTALLKIQTASPPEGLFGLYDQSELGRELNLFAEWFVPKLLGYELSSAERDMLDQTFSLLIKSALEQPQVVVHRDFHSRNLVFRENNSPGVIDFQDAVIGPVTYDLVSLLRDCYLQWPESFVYRVAEDYAKSLASAGILPVSGEQSFMRWFDWMGLQRHIKVLGIFSRLYLRDGKSAYLNDLPLVVFYTRAVAARYPELKPFSVWFDEVLLPLCQQQSWMKLL